MSASAVDRTYTEFRVGGRLEILLEAHFQYFSISTRLDRNAQALIVSGELDMATAPLLRSVLARACDRPPRRVDVDLFGVTSFDAYALAVLQVAARSMPIGWKLLLRNPSPVVREILAPTSSGAAFEVIEDMRVPARLSG